MNIENEVKVQVAGRRAFGKAIKNNIELQAEWEREIPEDPGNEEEERKNAAETKKCTNCQRLISEEDFEAHTIICFRYSEMIRKRIVMME